MGVRACVRDGLLGVGDVGDAGDARSPDRRPTEYGNGRDGGAGHDGEDRATINTQPLRHHGGTRGRAQALHVRAGPVAGRYQVEEMLGETSGRARCGAVRCGG